LFSVDARRHWVAPTKVSGTRSPQLPLE
jgi:hypothetical protein